jgi:hypothetical protein
MFSFFKKKLTYEEFGYKYADSLLLDVIELLALSASEWMGRAVNSESLGRDLSILSLAIFKLSLVDLFPEEEASRRTICGFLKRLSERYENFAFDSDTSAIGIEYLQIATADLRNRNKNVSFPTLVPLVITKITGLKKDNEYWYDASTVFCSLIEKVLKTSRQALAVTKDHSRLV